MKFVYSTQPLHIPIVHRWLYVWKAIWVFIRHFPISVIISRYREIEFLISGNEFPISGNDFRISGNAIISRYRELFPDIKKFISWYLEIIPDIPISEIRIPNMGSWFPDIANYFPISGNSISRYREMLNKNPNGFPYVCPNGNYSAIVIVT